MPTGVYLRNSTRLVPNNVTVLNKDTPVKAIVEVLQAKRDDIIRVVSILESLNSNEEGVRDNG